MAKEDDRAARDTTASLADALSDPIAAGSLEAALHAARAFHMRSPGDARAKRVVEALELLMSEVWLGADEQDARYAEAAACLEATDLAGARGRYTSILRSDPTEERASRLALRVDVVRCALAGAALPPVDDDDDLEVSFDFDDETRTAEDGELPLAAFEYDDVTVDGGGHIPPEAFRDEPTRELQTGQYQLVDERHVPAAGAAKETTRVAQPGELPLDQIRSQMDEERSDAELDLLLDEMESEAAPAPTHAERPGARRDEPSLELEIDIDDEIEGEPDEAPTEVAAATRKPRETSSRSFPRPKEEDLRRPPRRTPSRSFSKPVDEPSAPRALDGPPSRTVPRAPEPSTSIARPTFESSQPPPPPVIPRADELSAEAHAAMETDAEAAPSAQWTIREPGGDSPDPARGGVLDSWSGVRVYETAPATFEPGVEGVDADLWEDPTQVGAILGPEQEAEAAVERGDLGEALRLYQDLATRSPDDQRLWERVAEIARMLQQKS